MFRGYLNEQARYDKCFADGWDLTGDLAMRDSDGYYWFVGRADDVIKSAGHLIGPFEVEDVFMQHPAVAECGVVGAPDAERGQVVMAFVVLKQAHPDLAQLTRELQEYIKAQLAPYKYPRAIEFIDALPRTETGKVQRFKLRQAGK